MPQIQQSSPIRSVTLCHKVNKSTYNMPEEPVSQILVINRNVLLGGVRDLKPEGNRKQNTDQEQNALHRHHLC